MPKLKFKRTPEEEAEHQARKAARKERKRKREHYRTPSPMPSSGKRAHKESKWDADEPQRKWASSDEEDRAGPSTRSDKRRSDASDDAMRAQMEDELFREKMFGAMGEDERLDGLESHLNSYVHIPDRWKSAAMGSSGKALYDADEFLRLDPSTLDDDEYAEWIRLGMYRKTHAEENAARVRRKVAAEERRAAEKARRDETRRLEKLAEEERKAKKREREAVKRARAIEEYHSRWKDLLEEANQPHATERQLRFEDIPWPIYPVPDELGEGHFSKEAVSTFLLVNKDEDRKRRKEILRETFLRFHPDKFEGRFMRRVVEEEKARVREAIGQISRVLNHLLEDNTN